MWETQNEFTAQFHLKEQMRGYISYLSDAILYLPMSFVLVTLIKQLYGCYIYTCIYMLLIRHSVTKFCVPTLWVSYSEVILYHLRKPHFLINPRRACARVLVLSVCLSVCYHLIVDIVRFYGLPKVRVALF